jgi:hypothetical protein
MRRAALLVVLLSLIGSGCSGSSGEVVPPGGARTYFEALDLSTPSAAAETLLHAFARDDFMTVWLVLHPVTQYDIREALRLLQAGAVVDHLSIPPARYEEIYTSFPPVISDGDWALFDALMLAADEHDAFLIDLSGPVQVADEALDGDNAELSAAAEGVDGPVTIRMARSPDGTWRVLEVASGGEGAQVVVWPNRQPMP